MKITRYLNILLLVLLSLIGHKVIAKSSNVYKSILPISVQLWSVRDALKKDFEGTLKQLSEMGFDAVEFAGEYGNYHQDAKGLRSYLDLLGLKVSGAHISFQQFEPEQFKKSVSFFKELGAPILIVGWDTRSFNPDKVADLVSDLNQLAINLAPHQLVTGFHNHSQDMSNFKQSTFWDYIATSTPHNVILQMDVGWMIYAGKDPIEYIKRYPGRTVSTHYKAKFPQGTEFAEKLPLIGQDQTDWAKIINVNLTVGGTLWLVLEQEEYPKGLTPLQAVRESKRGLDRILRELTNIGAD